MTSAKTRILNPLTFFCATLLLLAFEIPGVLARPGFQQDTTSKTTQGKAWVELAAYGSTASRTPFWLHANQWGIVPTSGQLGSLRLGVEGREILSKDTSASLKWSLPYGVELVGNASEHSKLLIPQAYAGIALGSFQLTVGRRKKYVGFNDHELGTGSYMWSGNALPVPRIELAFENYVPVIRNFLYFKGFYSDGWLGNKRPVTSELKLHNKGLFVRLGRPNGKVKLHGGFNHAVQWGGKSPYFTENGQMPRGLDKYWYVVSGFKPLKLKDISDFDRTNRIGNHVASLDAALELDFESVNVMLYRQNLVEDGSLFYLNNVKDGLNGVSFTMKNGEGKVFSLDKLTLELLYTKSQGGSVVDSTHIRGKDDYFNNAQVRDGWSYFGRGLGTPFITAGTENNWPGYADFFTNNNRVWVIHTGMIGRLNDATWTTKLSLSSNQGTYDQPLPGKIYQFSGIVELSKPVRWFSGSTLKGAISLDQGKLFDNAFGAMLSIRKNIAF
ncbi:capsule assembly Wzi family protein [Dyadobacter sp. CY323]|uniref:capsule assembly Wzi family protein n=1 Tax=Dyadobacter sp. CY323 TaxID=2907302 RepID=UPI001F43E5FB|nr:capsule assembly Wzi family protein [Dyadobacter sp. CY323]MCE6992602.1 capsule assembly Wzi family protein [Dyadobacter sp. CY323]